MVPMCVILDYFAERPRIIGLFCGKSPAIIGIFAERPIVGLFCRKDAVIHGCLRVPFFGKAAYYGTLLRKGHSYCEIFLRKDLIVYYATTWVKS